MRLSWLASICLGFHASLALASQVFVEPATGSGVNEGDLDTATQLVRNAVPDVSSNILVESPDQADYSLRPNLMKLGQAYEMGLQKVNKDGSVAFSSQLKAERMDELDKVANRLTRSVLAGTRASNDTRVGEITNQESHEGNQRRPVRGEWYIGAGGSSFSNLNVSGIGYSFGLARAWDFNSGLFKILGEFDGLNSAFATNVGLGGEYFIVPTDLAPYVSGDFGFGAAKASGGGGFFSGTSYGGFEVGIGTGVEIMRTAATNLDIAFRTGFLLKNSGYGSPTIFSLRLGLYF